MLESGRHDEPGDANSHNLSGNDPEGAQSGHCPEPGQPEEQPCRLSRRACRERDDPESKPLSTDEVVAEVMDAARGQQADSEEDGEVGDYDWRIEQP